MMRSNPRRSLCLAVASLPMTTSFAWAQSGAGGGREELRFSGIARDLTTGEVLYTEVHEQSYVKGRWVKGRIEYRSPAGDVLGDKTLDFSKDPYVPLMRMQLPSQDYEEGITRVGAEGADVFARRGAERLSERLPRDSDSAQVADSGFHSFLQDNLVKLERGEEVTLRFVLVGRRDQYRFRLYKTGNPTAAAGSASRRLIEIGGAPDSLLRLFASPLKLVYDLDSRRLVSYEGPSNLPNAKTGKVPTVRIDY